MNPVLLGESLFLVQQQYLDNKKKNTIHFCFSYTGIIVNKLPTKYFPPLSMAFCIKNCHPMVLKGLKPH